MNATTPSFNMFHDENTKRFPECCPHPPWEPNGNATVECPFPCSAARYLRQAA
jgi:low affinity Fe/Cu permease